jgi:hypothetical protein
MPEERSQSVPSTEGCRIDFTSESQSPSRSFEVRFREGSEFGQIDSDIASSSSIVASPKLSVFHPDNGVNPRDLMLDEPIVAKDVSPRAKREARSFNDLPALQHCEEDMVMDYEPVESYFAEAFAAATGG